MTWTAERIKNERKEGRGDPSLQAFRRMDETGVRETLANSLLSAYMLKKFLPDREKKKKEATRDARTRFKDCTDTHTHTGKKTLTLVTPQ